MTSADGRFQGRRAGRYSRGGLLSALLTVCCVVHAAQYAGRSVADLLAGLQAQGISFIYSTETVPADLRVLREPQAQQGVALAREVLAQHGLTLVAVTPSMYSVVRDASTPSATAAAAKTPLVEEIVVQTSRYTLLADDVDSHAFLTQEQVKSMPRLADETLRAVERLPGVATNGFSSLNSIRGGEPYETAIVLDGLRLYEPFHLKNFLSPVSLLDSRLIEGVNVYSGGYPALYGNSMSAIIDATTVHPVQPSYYELGLSLFHTNALGYREFMDGKGSALLSARRSNVGDLVQFSESDFGEPNYSDAFARVTYRLSDATRAAANFLLSSDRIDARRDDGAQQARAEYRNKYLWTTLEHTWSERADSRLIASFTDIVNERSGMIDSPGEREVTVLDDRSFHVAGLRLENRFDSGFVKHRYGAEVRHLWGDYNYRSQVHYHAGFPFPDSPAIDRSSALSPAPQGYETAAYWDGRMMLGHRWTLQTGLRFDTQTYDASGDAEQWSPRLSIMYELSRQTRLRASWGRFFQSQGINELQVEDGVERFYQAQHADHVILSIDHAFTQQLSLRVEGYRKYYRRIHPRFENLFDTLVLLPETEFDRVRVDPQSARGEGVEALLRLQTAGAWSGWLSYTWSRIQDRIDGRDVPRSWDQRHAVNLGVAFSYGPWSATLTDTYHSGWPTTQLEWSSNSPPQTVIGVRNAQRLNDFNSLDFRLTRTFALRRGVLDVFFEASNALSDANQCCVEYSTVRTANGTLVLEKDVDSWLPLVPSAGVLWRY